LDILVTTNNDVQVHKLTTDSIDKHEIFFGDNDDISNFNMDAHSISSDDIEEVRHVSPEKPCK